MAAVDPGYDVAARLVSEREPSADDLERERAIPTPTYRDPFYRSLERLTLSAIEATIWRTRERD